jgi:hypothetical protein
MLYLSQDEARAHILAQQGLSEPYSTPLKALHAVFGIQVQYAMSLPVALALRTKGVKPNWHKKEEHRDVLKGWTLRQTLHAHTAPDHAIVLAAFAESYFKRFCTWMKNNRGLSEAQVRKECEEVAKALADGPLTRQELHERLPYLKNVPMAGWGADVKGLAYLGKLKLIVTEAGPTQFALHEIEKMPKREEAIAELMRRYFSAYGPATLADFRYWSGMPLFEFQSIFRSIQDEFTEVEVEGLKGQRFMLGKVRRVKIPKAKLLAKFDPLTMGHADKSLFLAEKDRTKVFRIAAQVEAAVLIDGRMAGTWRIVRKGSGAEVVIEPFRRIAKARLPAIEREAKRAVKSLGLNLVAVRSVSD